MPLRELASVVAVDVGHVRVHGQVRSQRAQDVDLGRRVRDVVLAADHVGDLVEDVVDRTDEVVGGAPVGPDDHEVVQELVPKLDAAADRVVPRDDPILRLAEANRAVVLVGLSLGEQPVGELARLVGRVELERHVAVPVDPDPPKRVLDLLDRLGDLTARVRVLDPQQALTPLLTGEQPVEEERSDPSDVEEAGRARSHADADACHLSIVGRRWNSARTCRPAGESTRRSTGSRRSAATACRCSRRARACGGRRITSRRRSSGSRNAGPRRGSAASSVTRSTSCNLAAPDDAIYEKSIQTMRATMDAAPSIGADGVIFHVGSHLGRRVRAVVGSQRLTALAQILERCDGDTWLLMENSAGHRRDDRPLAGGAADAAGAARPPSPPRASVSIRATSTRRATT